MVLRTEDKSIGDKVEALTEAVDALRQAMEDFVVPRGLLTVGPQQCTVIGAAPDGDYVTVTYPMGADTVLSVQPPDGVFETRPAGTAGPYELGLRQAGLGRIVYAPQGSDGPTFVLPYSDAIPNAS